MKVYYCEGMRFFGDQMVKLHGFERYNPATDIEEPCFFEGLYFDQDYAALLNHKGKRIVFWNGSDLARLENGDHIKWQSNLRGLQALHLCHDIDQLQRLQRLGIVNARAHPLFFGDINKYQVSYKQSDKPEVYSHCHAHLEVRYGIPFVLHIAEKTPEVLFHIYGELTYNGSRPDNVVCHGWVEEDQHDEEIAKMQGCLQTVLFHSRPSQMCIKSALMAQYPLATEWFEGIPFANTASSVMEYLNNLVYQEEPNYALREAYIKKYKGQWEKICEMC